MSEYSNKTTRGAFIAAVFAKKQGFGNLTGGIFAIIVSSLFKAHFPSDPYESIGPASTVQEADYVWRIILMFGAIPAFTTFYWRMKMPEMARYTALVAKNAQQATNDMSKVLQVEIIEEQRHVEDAPPRKKCKDFGLFSTGFVKRHGLHLLGTTTTWFLLDVAYCSQNLFQKDIFTAVGWLPNAKTMNVLEEVYYVAKSQTLIALCGTVSATRGTGSRSRLSISSAGSRSNS